MFYNAFTNTQDALWRLLICLCIVSSIISTNNIASAAGTTTGGSGTPSSTNDIFGQRLCALATSLSGNIAKAIATVAVFALGVGLFMGKLQWGSAAITAIGIITVFSAGQVVDWLGGSDTSAACTQASP